MPFINNLIKEFPVLHYTTQITWNTLEDHLNDFITEDNLELCPDFQRGHIWTEEQQRAYIEFMFRKPNSGKDIYINHPGWMTPFKGQMLLVDGLQRLTAVLKFIKNELTVLNGLYRSDITFNIYRNPGWLPSDLYFNFHIARLQTKKEVIQWYIDFNSGGTPHSREEIERVKNLLNEKYID